MYSRKAFNGTQGLDKSLWHLRFGFHDIIVHLKPVDSSIHQWIKKADM